MDVSSFVVISSFVDVSSFLIETPKALTSFSLGLLQPWVEVEKEHYAESVRK